MRKLWVLLISHAVAVAVGFAAGIYALPILTAPDAPADTAVASVQAEQRFTARFERDLADSDALHWGQGDVFIGDREIALAGSLAPGPDYMLYLSPAFIETEAEFLKQKASMALVGPVKTFDNFIVPVPEGVDPSNYTTVIVWCESFEQFITAGQYR